MSGHSKWAQIKHQKGTADAKRGTLFTKLGNNISIAAREGGGGDPVMNFKLRIALENAKKANMPKENMERAIKRGTGELKGSSIEEIVYEAFIPGGAALLIYALTDNKNRAVGNIRRILGKYGIELGAVNSVSWMFEKKGVIRLADYKSKISDFEKFQLDLIENGAEDIQEQDTDLTIYTEMANLQKVKEYLEKQKINPDYASVEPVAKNKVKLENPKLNSKIENLFQELNDDEDINDYYSNLE